jgi:hypothetical protein
VAGRKKRGLPWGKCQQVLTNHVSGEQRPCGVTTAFRESTLCGSHSTQAATRLVSLLEEVEAEGAQIVTATLPVPIVEHGDLEIGADEVELRLALGEWLFRKCPELIAVLAAES